MIKTETYNGKVLYINPKMITKIVKKGTNYAVHTMGNSDPEYLTEDQLNKIL